MPGEIQRNAENGACLEFYLPVFDVYIEWKQYFSERVSKQIESQENVILIQGKKSLEFINHLNNQNEIFEIIKIFSELISMRNWYADTSINRFQANEIKRRFQQGKLRFGRIIEVLIECGYNIDIRE